MNEVTQITFYLELETHKALKMAAIKNDTTVTAIVKELVKKYLEEQA